jgi:hypothetical protein
MKALSQSFSVEFSLEVFSFTTEPEPVDLNAALEVLAVDKSFSSPSYSSSKPHSRSSSMNDSESQAR